MKKLIKTASILSVLICILLVCVNDTTKAQYPCSSQQIPSGQCNALVDIILSAENHVEIPDSPPCGYWNGVEWGYGWDTYTNISHLGCDEAAKVISLRAIVEDIPESIGNLTDLEELHLASKSGSIPDSIGNLTNLKNLRLQSGYEGYNLTGNIPDSLGNLTNLEILILSYNKLSGPIPESLGNLTNLKKAYLDHNKLSGPLPQSFGNLTKLENLDLGFNQISGTVPASWFNLGKDAPPRTNSFSDVYVDFHCNQFSGYVIPDSFVNISWNINYTFDWLVTVPDWFFDFPWGNTEDHIWFGVGEPSNCGQQSFEADIESSVSGTYFIQGVSVENQFDVLLIGSNSGTVEFDLNGNSVQQDASGGSASMEYDMGTDLNYSLQGEQNTLIIEATSQDEGETYSEEQELIGITPPAWLPALEAKPISNQKVITYSSTLLFPDPAFEGRVTPPDWVPFVGGDPLGIRDTQAEVILEVNSLGAGKAEISGETGFDIANQGFDGKLYGKGVTSIRQGTGIQLDEAEFGLEVAGRLEGERPVVDLICKTATGGLCPLKEAENQPVIGKPIKWLNDRAVAKAALEQDVTGTIYFKSDPNDESELTWESGTLDTDTKLTLALIINVIENIASAELSGGGQPKFTYWVPPNPSYLKQANIAVFAQLKVKIPFWEGTYPVAHNWSFSPGINGNNLLTASNVSGQTSITNIDWQPVPRYYASESTNYAVFQANTLASIQSANQPATLSTSEITIANNTFPDGHPALAAKDNTTLLLWVHDDISKPVMQGGEIKYSVNDGITWSTPANLTNDTLLDSSPQMAFDKNNQAIAVWERNKNLQSAASELNASYTNAIELAYAVWNGSNWSTPTFLTNNAVFDHAPTLVEGNNGNLLLIWRQNAAGELLGDSTNPDTLQYAVWDGISWSTPQLLLSNLVGMLSLTAARHDDTAMSIVYSLDTDDDFGTSTDQELYHLVWNGNNWSAPIRLTNDSQPDNSPTLFYNSSGQPRLLWLKGDTLYALLDDLSGTPQPVTVESSATMLDYTAVQDQDDNLALIWQGYSDEGVDIFYATYDETYNVFSDVLQLTADESLEKFMAPTIAPTGELLMAYNETALETQTLTISPTLTIENVTTFGQTDLNFLSHTFGPDLALETTDLIVNPIFPELGSTVQISATLKNAGDRTIINPTVKFYLGDPTAGGVLIDTVTSSLTMVGGMTTTVTIDWIIPDSGSAFIIYAVSDPEDTVVELNEDNNTASLTLETADSGSNIYLPIITK